MIMFFGRDFPTRIYERWRLCEVGERQRAAIAVPRDFRWRLEDTGEDHLSPLGVEAVDTHKLRDKLGHVVRTACLPHAGQVMSA